MEKSKRFKLKNFRFDTLLFQWGDHFSDVKSRFTPDSIFIESERPSVYSETLRYQLSSFLSLEASFITFEAPSQERLIHRITINLPPQEKNAKDILKVLRNEYGSPTDRERHTWNFKNCTLSVGFYSRSHTEYGTKCKACIHIFLKDLNLLDSLYGEPLKQESERIESMVLERSITKFSLSKRQRISWDGYQSDYPDRSVYDVSRVLNGFHKKELYHTPSLLRKNLNQHEVCIWQSKEGNYYISNHFETGILSKEKHIVWSVMTPAKGPGGLYLDIGDFDLRDEYDMDSYDALNAYIENLLNIKIKVYTQSDT